MICHKPNHLSVLVFKYKRLPSHFFFLCLHHSLLRLNISSIILFRYLLSLYNTCYKTNSRGIFITGAGDAQLGRAWKIWSNHNLVGGEIKKIKHREIEHQMKGYNLES